MNCSTEVLCVIWYIINVQNAMLVCHSWCYLLQVAIAIMTTYSLVRACGPIECEIKLMKLWKKNFYDIDLYLRLTGVRIHGGSYGVYSQYGWHMICNVYFVLPAYISPCALVSAQTIHGFVGLYRPDSGLAPSQWKTSLQSNAVSHWLGANLKSALLYMRAIYEITNTLVVYTIKSMNWIIIV